jgi:maleate cis-trans isomerase
VANAFSAETSYGRRAKIGVIVPTTNTVNEAEWQMMAPTGVTIHTARMPLHTDTSSDAGKKALYIDIEKSTGDLAQAGMSVVAYGCTAGSMSHPTNAIPDFMSGVSGTPCVTTAASIVAALQALKAKTVAVATPYAVALNEHERAFLEAAGFQVTGVSGLGIGAGGPQEYIQIACTPAEKIKAHVLAADHDDADAMLVSCTDFPVLEMICELEKTLGKPVVTSNQATFWAAIRAAGIDDRFENFGALLA